MKEGVVYAWGGAIAPPVLLRISWKNFTSAILVILQKL